MRVLEEPRVQGHVPPHDLELESTLLCCCLLGGAEAVGQVAALLTPDDLYRENNAAVYRACLALFRAGEPIEPSTVGTELDRTPGLLDRIGGRAHLHALWELVPTAAGIVNHALRLRDLAIIRSTVRLGTELVNKGLDGSAEASALQAEGQEHLLNIAMRGVESDFRPVAADLDEVAERADMIRSGKLPGLPTGFRDLDMLTGGLRPSQLTIVGADPGTGKSAFALGIALRVARTEKRPVAIFSLEMSRVELLDRAACMIGHVDSAKKARNELDEQEWQRFYDAMTELKGLPIYVDADSALTTTAMLSKIRALHSQESVALVIVDYLQLMRADDQREESRVRAVGGFALALSTMARQLQVPVLGISSLSRTSKDRPNWDDLNRLRESGEIGFHADLALMLYRDEIHNPNTDRPGVLEVAVVKNRTGPTGLVKLAFLKKYTVVAELVGHTPR